MHIAKKKLRHVVIFDLQKRKNTQYDIEITGTWLLDFFLEHGT
jgi:hypothetical protein